MVLGISKNKDKNSNALDQTVIINGNIEFDGVLTINCLVNGNITTKVLDKGNSLLIVKKNALIKGNVNANIIKFNGHIKGEMSGKDIALQSKAQVDGGVNYEIIQIDEGAVINGSLSKKTKIVMPNTSAINANNKNGVSYNTNLENKNIEHNKKSR